MKQTNIYIYICILTYYLSIFYSLLIYFTSSLSIYSIYIYILIYYIHNIYIYIILYIHFLLNLDSSPFYLAMVQSQCLKVIGRNCGLSNLCYSCRFTCQQCAKNVSWSPGYLCSKNEIV